MSDEVNLNDETLEITADSAIEDEYEEISSDEVDRVVEALDQLIESVESENVAAYLEECSNHILALVYDETDLDDSVDEAA